MTVSVCEPKMLKFFVLNLFSKNLSFSVLLQGCDRYGWWLHIVCWGGTVMREWFLQPMGGDLKKHLTLDFMVNYTPVSANIGDSEFYFRDMTDMDDDHFLF